MRNVESGIDRALNITDCIGKESVAVYGNSMRDSSLR